MRLRKRDNLGPRSSPREQLAFSTWVLSDDTNYLGRALSPVWEFTCHVNRETGPDQKFISPLLVESASIVGSDWSCSKDGKRGRDWIKSQRKGWEDQCLVTKEDYVRKALQCSEFWRIFDTKKSDFFVGIVWLSFFALVVFWRIQTSQKCWESSAKTGFVTWSFLSSLAFCGLGDIDYRREGCSFTILWGEAGTLSQVHNPKTGTSSVSRFARRFRGTLPKQFSLRLARKPTGGFTRGQQDVRRLSQILNTFFLPKKLIFDNYLYIQFSSEPHQR